MYGAAGAGAALVVGAGAIVLENEKGAVLSLNGRQVGLIANLDLSGMAIALALSCIERSGTAPLRLTLASQVWGCP